MATTGHVSIDGEEYVPKRDYDALRDERDRLAEELARLGGGTDEREPDEG